MADLIEAEHLNKSFGRRLEGVEVLAVQDFSLHVTAGEIYGLVGPDGAGKTTAIRMLVGAYLPSHHPGAPAPAIRIGGVDMLQRTEQARAQLGYLPQRFSLYEDLTVIENIRFFAEVRGLPTADWQPRCLEILEFVGLVDFLHRRAGLLSGGMKQKLGLAAALVHNPRVLLLDEPTTGVDPVTRQDFWQLLIRLVGQSASGKQATAVLVSTPYMDEAARCTRVGFMRQGQLAVEGTPAELCRRLQGRVIELIGQPSDLLRRLGEQRQADPSSGIEAVQMFGDRLHLRARPGCADRVMTDLAQAIPAQGGQITRLQVIPAQLEDVFMELLEGGA